LGGGSLKDGESSHRIINLHINNVWPLELFSKTSVIYVFSDQIAEKLLVRLTPIVALIGYPVSSLKLQMWMNSYEYRQKQIRYHICSSCHCCEKTKTFSWIMNCKSTIYLNLNEKSGYLNDKTNKSRNLIHISEIFLSGT
jgi:hypothetical protein